MVFQQFNLFPHLTVLKNLTVAQTGVLGRSKAEAISIAREMLERVGLSDKTHDYPAHLSGGQQGCNSNSIAIASVFPFV